MMTNEKAARDRHHATVEERLEFLEKQVGDAADFHSKAMQSMENNHKKLVSSLEEVHSKVKGEKEARSAHHATIAERLEFLEKFVGESADKHERHLKEIESAKSRLADMNGAVFGEKAAREKHHATMEQRLEQIEKLLGESIDTHSKSVRQLELKHGDLRGLMDALHGHVKNDKESRNADHSLMNDKLSLLEVYMNDSASKHDKHLKEIDAAHSKIRELQNLCAADKAHIQRHHSTVEERLEYLEKQVSETADSHDNAVKSFEQSTRKLNNSLDELIVRVKSEKEFRDATHSTFHERVEIVEKFIIESGDKHDKHLKDIDTATSRLRDLQASLAADRMARDQYRLSFEERIDLAEKTFAESADNCAKSIESLEFSYKKMRGNLDEFNAMIRGEKDERRTSEESFAERLDYLERFVGDSSEKHGKYMKDLESANARLKDITGRVQGGQHQANERHASLEERLESVERFLGDNSDKQSDLTTMLKELREVLGDQSTIVRTEHLAKIHQILAGEKSSREAHELAMQKHIQGERMMRDTFENSLEQHLKLEKEAREAHHSHVRNQIEQEQKAREASTESFKKLIAHERASREQALQTLNELVLTEKANREQSQATYADVLARAQSERERQRTTLEEILVQERQEQSKHHDGIFERIDSLERTVGFFDELGRKDREERLKESKRIWDAIDSHTHDLSTTVMKADSEEIREYPRSESRVVDVEPNPRILRPVHVVPLQQPSSMPQMATASTSYFGQAATVIPSTTAKNLSVYPLVSSSPISTASIRASSAHGFAARSTSVTRRTDGGTFHSMGHLARAVEPVSPRETSVVEERITCGRTRYGTEARS